MRPVKKWFVDGKAFDTYVEAKRAAGAAVPSVYDALADVVETCLIFRDEVFERDRFIGIARERFHVSRRKSNGPPG